MSCIIWPCEGEIAIGWADRTGKGDQHPDGFACRQRPVRRREGHSRYFTTGGGPVHAALRSFGHTQCDSTGEAAATQCCRADDELGGRTSPEYMPDISCPRESEIAIGRTDGIGNANSDMHCLSGRQYALCRLESHVIETTGGN